MYIYVLYDIYIYIYTLIIIYIYIYSDEYGFMQNILKLVLNDLNALIFLHLSFVSSQDYFQSVPKFLDQLRPGHGLEQAWPTFQDIGTIPIKPAPSEQVHMTGWWEVVEAGVAMALSRALWS